MSVQLRKASDRAFAMLRDHSQNNGRKVVDVAQAIVDSHLLLLPPPTEPTATELGSTRA